ncbi:MAG: hypothetical protein ACOX79_11185 [Methanosarcina sp.]|nr:hypothetical protein [Methanosarcina sp.]
MENSLSQRISTEPSNQKILKDYLRKCKTDGLKEATTTTAEATLTPFIYKYYS